MLNGSTHFLNFNKIRYKMLNFVLIIQRYETQNQFATCMLVESLYKNSLKTKTIYKDSIRILPEIKKSRYIQDFATSVFVLDEFYYSFKILQIVASVLIFTYFKNVHL